MNDKKPNDLPNQGNQLPTSTRGQIDKLCQNPAIEQKRRIRHLEVMRGNTNALKSGNYSKLHPTPEYLFDYLDYVDNLQFDQPREIIELMTRIIKSNLKRIALKEHLESADCEIGNKQLTQMMKDTFVMAQSVGHFVAIQKAEIGNQPFDIQDIRSLTDDEKNVTLQIVRTALQSLRESKNTLATTPS